MARHREFDPHDALDKAMRLFWRKGYAETSVRDLVHHTGVAHAGLYGEFGGKRGLYRAALDHYDATFGNMLLGPLEAPEAGRVHIEKFFAVILVAATGGRFGNGCFMCNTAIEFGNDPGDVLAAPRRNIDRMAAAFRGALAHAHAHGEVRDELDPDATADFLVSAFHGIAVLARAKTPPERIAHAVQTALRVLE